MSNPKPVSEARHGDQGRSAERGMGAFEAAKAPEARV